MPPRVDTPHRICDFANHHGGEIVPCVFFNLLPPQMSSAPHIRSPYYPPSIRSHLGFYVTFARRLALYYSIFVVLCLFLGYRNNGLRFFLSFSSSFTCSLPPRPIACPTRQTMPFWCSTPFHSTSLQRPFEEACPPEPHHCPIDKQYPSAVRLVPLLVQLVEPFVISLHLLPSASLIVCHLN